MRSIADLEDSREVTGVSIRLRILKAGCVPGEAAACVLCYRGIDPFEDTERSVFAVAIAAGVDRYRGIDPFEDTESSQPMPLGVIHQRYRGIDPFEDTESVDKDYGYEWIG